MQVCGALARACVGAMSLAVVLFGLLFLAAQGFAQQNSSAGDASASDASGGPSALPVSRLSEQFGSWSVMCVPEGRADGDDDVPSVKPSCRMLQSHKIGEAEQDILAISLVYDNKAESGFGIISVPQHVYLAPDIEIRVDERRPFRVLYEYCGNSSCHAGFKLTGIVLGAFRQGLNAKTRVWFGVDKAVDVDVSLKGFTAAFRRLEELSL